MYFNYWVGIKNKKSAFYHAINPQEGFFIQWHHTGQIREISADRIAAVIKHLNTKQICSYYNSSIAYYRDWIHDKMSWEEFLKEYDLDWNPLTI